MCGIEIVYCVNIFIDGNMEQKERVVVKTSTMKIIAHKHCSGFYLFYVCVMFASLAFINVVVAVHLHHIGYFEKKRLHREKAKAATLLARNFDSDTSLFYVSPQTLTFNGYFAGEKEEAVGILTLFNQINSTLRFALVLPNESDESDCSINAGIIFGDSLGGDVERRVRGSDGEQRVCRGKEGD